GSCALPIEIAPGGDQLEVDVGFGPDDTPLAFCGDIVSATIYRWTPAQDGIATVELDWVEGEGAGVIGFSDGQLCEQGQDAGLACAAVVPQASNSASLAVQAGTTYLIIVGGHY